jgi:hypothetical protein
MDPRAHQRDVGEKEHYPPQDRPARTERKPEEEAREKAAKNNKDRHEQTGRARAAASSHTTRGRPISER